MNYSRLYLKLSKKRFLLWQLKWEYGKKQRHYPVRQLAFFLYLFTFLSLTAMNNDYCSSIAHCWCLWPRLNTQCSFIVINLRKEVNNRSVKILSFVSYMQSLSPTSTIINIISNSVHNLFNYFPTSTSCYILASYLPLNFSMRIFSANISVRRKHSKIIRKSLIKYLIVRWKKEFINILSILTIIFWSCFLFAKMRSNIHFD